MPNENYAGMLLGDIAYNITFPWNDEIAEILVVIISTCCDSNLQNQYSLFNPSPKSLVSYDFCVDTKQSLLNWSFSAYFGCGTKPRMLLALRVETLNQKPWAYYGLMQTLSREKIKIKISLIWLNILNLHENMFYHDEINHELFENYFIYFLFLFIVNHAIVYGSWSCIILRFQHGKETRIWRLSQKRSMTLESRVWTELNLSIP